MTRRIGSYNSGRNVQINGEQPVNLVKGYSATIGNTIIGTTLGALTARVTHEVADATEEVFGEQVTVSTNTKFRGFGNQPVTLKHRTNDRYHEKPHRTSSDADSGYNLGGQGPDRFGGRVYDRGDAQQDVYDPRALDLLTNAVLFSTGDGDKASWKAYKKAYDKLDSRGDRLVLRGTYTVSVNGVTTTFDFGQQGTMFTSPEKLAHFVQNEGVTESASTIVTPTAVPAAGAAAETSPDTGTATGTNEQKPRKLGDDNPGAPIKGIGSAPAPRPGELEVPEPFRPGEMPDEYNMDKDLAGGPNSGAGDQAATAPASEPAKTVFSISDMTTGQIQALQAILEAKNLSTGGKNSVAFTRGTTSAAAMDGVIGTESNRALDLLVANNAGKTREEVVHALINGNADTINFANLPNTQKQKIDQINARAEAAKAAQLAEANAAKAEAAQPPAPALREEPSATQQPPSSAFAAALASAGFSFSTQNFKDPDAQAAAILRAADKDGNKIATAAELKMHAENTPSQWKQNADALAAAATDDFVVPSATPNANRSSGARATGK